jgi:hypothetical protein
VGAEPYRPDLSASGGSSTTSSSIVRRSHIATTITLVDRVLSSAWQPYAADLTRPPGLSAKLQGNRAPAHSLDLPPLGNTRSGVIKSSRLSTTPTCPSAPSNNSPRASIRQSTSSSFAEPILSQPGARSESGHFL